jgi:hypothetical protein
MIPGKAINCWQEGFDEGKSLYHQRKWQAALSHLGLAFEAAEIIITTMAIAPKHAYELFVTSAELLADTFGQLGYFNQYNEVYKMTINRLRQDLNCHPESKVLINQRLASLYQQTQYADLINGTFNLETSYNLN